MNWNFQSFGIIVIVERLLIATLLGLLLGINRELKNRGAGTRTHCLVSMAACLVMLTSEYISMRFPQFTGDITRLGAQVISGMGFIGAGTIIFTRNSQVRGLTTAASLWASTCIGLAVGIGFWPAAVIATLMMLTVLIVLTRLDKVLRKHAVVYNYVIEFADIENLSDFLGEIRRRSIRVINFEIDRGKEGEGPLLYVTLEYKGDMTQTMLELHEKVSMRSINEL